MRPLYESDSDRQAEDEVADFLARSWRCRVLKLSMAYGLDRALISGKRGVVAFVEVKCRDLPYGYGDGYYISGLKAMMARLITAALGKPCYLVTRFRDGTVWWTHFNHRRDHEVIEAGRYDRGDPFDVEPHVIIPWQHWRRLRPRVEG